MKKYIDQLALLHTILTLLFFSKIIQTEIGLITYSTTTIIFMFYVLYINKRIDSTNE